MRDSNQTAAWRSLDTNEFINLIGPLFRSTGVGEKKHFGFQADDRHLNSVGLVHGGVMASLLDQVIAIEAWNAADRAPLVTVQMDTRFMGSARTGDFIEARANVRHATRSLIFVDADLNCGSETIATASAVMKVIKSKANQK